jgi:hypothetical protein
MIKLRVPQHILPTDTSVAANDRRYDLVSRAAFINPKGFRTVGKNRGITKPIGKNWVTSLAQAYAA